MGSQSRTQLSNFTFTFISICRTTIGLTKLILTLLHFGDYSNLIIEASLDIFSYVYHSCLVITSNNLSMSYKLFLFIGIILMDSQISILYFNLIISKSHSVLSSSLATVFHALLKKKREKLNDLKKFVCSISLRNC